MNHRILALLLLFVAGISCAGCASPWEKNFEPNPDLSGPKLPPTTSVESRTIPFERYQHYVEDERRRRIQSSTAPQDLSAEDRLADKNRLLETLQLKERGDEIEVLGWSEFNTDEKLSPNDPKLRKFAEKIGADIVVIASTYAGQVTRVEDRPVTTYSHGFTTFAHAHGRRGAVGGTYSDQTTSRVPVQVTEDQFFYEAIFLRSARQPPRGVGAERSRMSCRYCGKNHCSTSTTLSSVPAIALSKPAPPSTMSTPPP